MEHCESAIRALHEQRHEYRKRAIQAAGIRALVCDSRGIPRSSGCYLTGMSRLNPVPESRPFGFFSPESPDSEGGTCD